MRASAILVTLVSLGVSVVGAGCAPSGQGDPCTPESIPSDGFVANEVYVETSSVQCRTRVCMVFHLTGNPECTSGVDADCGRPPAPGNSCVAPDGDNLCVQVDDPANVQIDDNSPDRVFCTCRCSAGGNASLPLCQCTQGYRCIPDTDPGGGYCVLDALALQAGICNSDAECVTLGSTLGTCDESHHCR